MRKIFSVGLILCTALFAGCLGSDSQRAVLPGTEGASGGILNDLPTWNSFSGDLSTADNGGSVVEVFTGSISDANGEDDLEEITVNVLALGEILPESHSHTVLLSEAQTLSEPASFGVDGFKVWGGTQGDGILHFKFEYTWALGTALGLAVITPIADDGGLLPVIGPIDNTILDLFSQIDVLDLPLGLDGLPSGVNWGLWSAAPGTTNVSSLNFLALANLGLDDTASAVIDFNEASFVGQTNANESVPIDGNIEFAWIEMGVGQIPSNFTFNYGAASPDGSVTVTFSQLASTIVVAYRIPSLPAIVSEQSYEASFTVTEL